MGFESSFIGSLIDYHEDDLYQKLLSLAELQHSSLDTNGKLADPSPRLGFSRPEKQPNS